MTQCVRGLDFPRSELPPNFHYVGPLRGPEEPLAIELPDDRPLVFCSLGTLQGSRAGIFRAVAEAAAAREVTLLIAHGGMLAEREIARLPGRPLVHGFVPQRAVLARATAAITHCGFNTVLDALAASVPMVGLPITFEQPATGARLQRAGAAEVLQRGRSPRRIRRALERVFAEPAYGSNAGKLANEIAGAGGVRRAADLIEQSLGLAAPPAGATKARAAPDGARGGSRNGSSSAASPAS
jgi:MGT family glycosyltransferase